MCVCVSRNIRFVFLLKPDTVLVYLPVCSVLNIQEKMYFFWLCMFSANHTLMGRALVDATQSVVLVANASTSWGAIAAN